MKRREETRAIPVIVVSARHARPDELCDTGAFIAKPFDLAAVGAAVGRYLATR